MRPVLKSRYGWEPLAISFFGDPHIGHNAKLTAQLKSDLDGAKERGDVIVLWGDIADWILPSDRKRYTSGQHNTDTDAAINKQVRQLVEFLKPYVNNIAIMKLGNHETAVIKYHHVDPMQMLVAQLNAIRDEKLPPIFYGGYSMWWIVQLTSKKQGVRDSPGKGKNVKFWLHHGAGGSSPVTKGAIDRARIYDTITADVCIIGHKHTSLHVTTKHERVDDYGNVRREDRDFLILPGYSGWEQDAPGEDGYTLNWSAENFYGLESTGYKRIVLVPGYKRINGRQELVIKRTIETDSE